MRHSSMFLYFLSEEEVARAIQFLISQWFYRRSRWPNTSRTLLFLLQIVVVRFISQFFPTMSVWSFSVVLWKNGKLLVWDATCPDIYDPWYLAGITMKGGASSYHCREEEEQILSSKTQTLLYSVWQLRPQEFWDLWQQPYYKI